MVRAGPGIGDVQDVSLGRESDAVGHRQIVQYHAHVSGAGVELEDAMAREPLRFDGLVYYAPRGVGEVDGPVHGVQYGIVGAVQPLPIVAGRQHRRSWL